MGGGADGGMGGGMGGGVGGGGGFLRSCSSSVAMKARRIYFPLRTPQGESTEGERRAFCAGLDARCGMWWEDPWLSYASFCDGDAAGYGVVCDDKKWRDVLALAFRLFPDRTLMIVEGVDVRFEGGSW
jgi:hypothetical protein